MWRRHTGHAPPGPGRFHSALGQEQPNWSTRLNVGCRSEATSAVLAQRPPCLPKGNQERWLQSLPASAAEPAEEAALLLRPRLIGLRPAEPAPAARALLLLLWRRFAAGPRRALLRCSSNGGSRCRCATASGHRRFGRLDRIG